MLELEKNFRLLRPVDFESKRELEMILAWRNNPNVRANMFTNHEISWEEHLAWSEKTRASNDEVYFIYCLDDLPQGVVGFNKINLLNKNSFWAFYAAPDAKRGIGSKMEFLAIEYAFNILELHKLSCEVLDFNMAVINLHKKFGFEIEGVFKENHMIKNQFFDVYRLAIFKSTWNEKRELISDRVFNLGRS